MGTKRYLDQVSKSGTQPEPVILVDEAGNRVSSTTSGGDAASNTANTPVLRTRVEVFNGTAWDRARSTTPTADAIVPTLGVLQTSGLGFGFNGATWDRLRTAKTFKPFSVTVASVGTAQAAWTPTSGKRFRFMGMAISSDKAAIVNVKDGTVATIWATSKFAANGIYATPPNIGNGSLSASANNVLQIDVDSGVPVVVSGTVFGTEE